MIKSLVRRAAPVVMKRLPAVVAPRGCSEDRSSAAAREIYCRTGGAQPVFVSLQPITTDDMNLGRVNNQSHLQHAISSQVLNILLAGIRNFSHLLDWFN